MIFKIFHIRHTVCSQMSHLDVSRIYYLFFTLICYVIRHSCFFYPQFKHPWSLCNPWREPWDNFHWPQSIPTCSHLCFPAISLGVEIQLHRRSKRRREPPPNEHRKAQKLLVLGKSVMLFKRGCKKVCATVYTGIDEALGPEVKD